MQYNLEEDDCIVSITELNQLVDGLYDIHRSLSKAITESSDKSLLKEVTYDLRQLENYANYWSL